MMDRSEESPFFFTSHARTGIDNRPHTGHLPSTADSWDAVEPDLPDCSTPWICLGINDFQGAVNS
jgi:hypothetical protein